MEQQGQGDGEGSLAQSLHGTAEVEGAAPGMGCPEQDDEGEQDVALVDGAEEKEEGCGEGEEPREQHMARVAYAIGEAVGEVASRLHEEEAFLAPVSGRVGHLLQQEGLGMETEDGVAGSAVLVDHDVAGAREEVGVLGKSPMLEEERAPIAQVGSQEAVGSVALGPGQMHDLLPALEETATESAPAAQVGELGESHHHLGLGLAHAGLCHMGEPVGRCRLAVGVGEHHPFVGGRAHGQGYGQTDGTDVAGAFGRADDVEVEVLFLQLLEQQGRLVGAVEVGDDDFEGTWEFLFQHEGQMAAQGFALLVADDDDTDGRQGLGFLGGRVLLHELGHLLILQIAEHGQAPEQEIEGEGYDFGGNVHQSDSLV